MSWTTIRCHSLRYHNWLIGNLSGPEVTAAGPVPFRVVRPIGYEAYLLILEVIKIIGLLFFLWESIPVISPYICAEIANSSAHRRSEQLFLVSRQPSGLVRQPKQAGCVHGLSGLFTRFSIIDANSNIFPPESAPSGNRTCLDNKSKTQRQTQFHSHENNENEIRLSISEQVIHVSTTSVYDHRFAACNRWDK